MPPFNGHLPPTVPSETFLQRTDPAQTPQSTPITFRKIFRRQRSTSKSQPALKFSIMVPEHRARGLTVSEKFMKQFKQFDLRVLAGGSIHWSGRDVQLSNLDLVHVDYKICFSGSTSSHRVEGKERKKLQV
ncbi:hypothetical protein Tcan_03971 [Toxocara canis]|uniref:Uncharacterized protein n=1 Tax=Toxocara canis TaxID=6265 RepID=A0A0B2VLN6_TOXCA|nr:hypothetical protein Tcan_03971 [Toxocara canis]